MTTIAFNLIDNATPDALTLLQSRLGPDVIVNVVSGRRVKCSFPEAMTLDEAALDAHATAWAVGMVAEQPHPVIAAVRALEEAQIVSGTAADVQARVRSLVFALQQGPGAAGIKVSPRLVADGTFALGKGHFRLHATLTVNVKASVVDILFTLKALVGSIEVPDPRNLMHAIGLADTLRFGRVCVPEDVSYEPPAMAMAMMDGVPIVAMRIANVRVSGTTIAALGMFPTSTMQRQWEAAHVQLPRSHAWACPEGWDEDRPPR